MKITGGGSSFLCYHRYLEALGLDPQALAPGQDLSGEASDLLRRAAAATEAERRAVGLLARAEQARALLAAKLQKHELSREAIGLALDYLEAKGLLSDQRFAEAWLGSRPRNGAQGPAKMAQALRAKGLSEAVVKAAMASVFGEEERRLLLEAAWLKALKKCGGDREAAKDALRALGFKGQEIRDYFESLE